MAPRWPSPSCVQVATMAPVTWDEGGDGEKPRSTADCSFDEDEACYICYESGGRDLLRTGCACRGSVLVHVHYACAVTAARADERLWTNCPTCTQDWTGMELRLRLAREHHRLACEQSERSGPGAGDAAPEENLCRLEAARVLIGALRAHRQLDEALVLAQQNLSIQRRVLCEGHDHTLATLSLVVGILREIGEHAAALPLAAELLAVTRHRHSDDAFMVLIALESAGQLNVSLRNFDAALPLLRENLQLGRQTFGDDHPGTIMAMSRLGRVYTATGNHSLALPLHKECLERSLRVLGSDHTMTLRLTGQLGMFLIDSMQDATAGKLLLEEATAGLMIAYGPDTMEAAVYQDILDAVAISQAQGAAAEAINPPSHSKSNDDSQVLNEGDDETDEKDDDSCVVKRCCRK